MRFGDPSAVGDLDRLSWREFEHFVAELFSRAGYETKHVGGLRDHGADVIARRGDEQLAIQVKHKSGKRNWVGERAVQAVVTSLPLHECTRGVVVTNGEFAPGTAKVAAAHGVELWDRARLELELASFCVLCGRHVSERVRSWCLDRKEEFGGLVYCFDHQRRFTGLLRSPASAPA